MTMLAAALVLSTAVAQAVIPQPAGVNDIVLGKAEEFRVDGPARVCLVRSSFDLRDGEASYLKYMGIHWASITILGPGGSVEISEGDIYARPKNRGTVVARLPSASVRRIRTPEGLRYAVFVDSSSSYEREHPLLWLEGTALNRSTASDLAIFHRLTIDVVDKKSCKRRFMYGWFFDEETEGK